MKLYICKDGMAPPSKGKEERKKYTRSLQEKKNETKKIFYFFQQKEERIETISGCIILRKMPQNLESPKQEYEKRFLRL